MNAKDALAARLRQAIQGCSIHNHGPVQAWAAIEQAGVDGTANTEEVARVAIEACTQRIADLLAEGVSKEDLRIKKEELTRAFIQKLFL